jgi:hypothetical protein
MSLVVMGVTLLVSTVGQFFTASMSDDVPQAKAVESIAFDMTKSATPSVNRTEPLSSFGREPYFACCLRTGARGISPSATNSVATLSSGNK